MKFHKEIFKGNGEVWESHEIELKDYHARNVDASETAKFPGSDYAEDCGDDGLGWVTYTQLEADTEGFISDPYTVDINQ